MRVVEKQDEVIAAQSAIIDELCQLMVEHITQMMMQHKV